MVPFVIDITLFVFHTKKVKGSVPWCPVFTQPVQLFLCGFLFVWCKSFGIISKEKRATKREKNGQE